MLEVAGSRILALEGPPIIRRLAAPWALALSITACFDPTYPQGLLCGPNGECPEGQECELDNRCRSPAGEADGSPADGADADAAPGVDAPRDACVPADAELCNGIDDTCEGAVDEGFTLGTACDGPDLDMCTDDAVVCDASQTGTTCGNTSGDDDLEACNGLDEDCDGSIDEDFALGAPCDGADADLCLGGVIVCNAAGTGTLCDDTARSTFELCNGIDDDCDGMVDEAYAIGTPCDGFDADLCQEGATICDGATGTVCDDTTDDAVELCDLVDNDCDGSVDEGYGLGVPCDGEDADLCIEGVTICHTAGTGTTCNDRTWENVERCNGVDDDCDGSTDEGFVLESPCDGDDADLCVEGVTVCDPSGAATTCDDTTDGTSELCNGIDDDCDGMADEGFVLGVPCDGPDADLCIEGVTTCDAGGAGTVCGDLTPSNAEVCDGTDNDCDGSTDDGFAVGLACDGADGDLCNEGTTVCNASGTGTTCSDTSATILEVCNGVDDDCDGMVDDGALCPGGSICCPVGACATSC